MTYEEIIEKVSGDIGISPDIINKTYKAFWLYIRNSIQTLPLKQDITDDEFSALKPNFNIPSLGKLVCTLDRYKGVKKRFQYIKNIRNKHEETN